MPDNSQQPSEGRATVECKITVRQKKVLAFSADFIVLSEAEILDSVHGASSGLFTFRALNSDFVENLKDVMADANPLFQFRLGFGQPETMFWLPWQNHIVVHYLAKFQGIENTGGHLLVLYTNNDLVRQERSNKMVARKGTISEIVKAIAAENNLESVVEPTSGKFILYQSFLDDTRFVRLRCLPRAITQNGRGGFYFYIRDNVLHFHTPDYQGNVLEMNYYRAFSTNLTVNDMSQEPALWDAGLSGVRLISQNPYTAKSKEFKSQPQNSLKLADSIYEYSNVNNGEWNVPYHLGFNPDVEAEAIAQHMYQTTRQKTFTCTVTMNKTINIRHGDLLNLSITQQGKSASSHSGYYYVTTVGHTVKNSAVSTVYTLERGELRGQEQSLSVQNRENQIVPLSEAPGQKPNLLEMQSSELTKGAGKQSSARTYAVVADANTGK